jgi:hypothetical protein
LSLGGYHKDKIVPHETRFPMYTDDEVSLTLSVQNIRLSDSSHATKSVLNTPTLTLIDSNRPYLYLPPDAYNAILSHLGLHLDTESEHILISEEKHAQLKSSKFSLEFELAEFRCASENKVPDKTVKITVPYETLALTLGYPYLQPTMNQSWYLPIRPGNPKNPNYVLGRAFLQESYIVADYESNLFKVHQVNWDKVSPSGLQVMKETVEPINLSVGDKTMNMKAIIAAAVAGGIGLLLVLFLLYCCLRQRRKRREKKAKEAEQKKSESPVSPGDVEAKLVEADSSTVHELPSRVGMDPVEMDTKSDLNEMPDYNGILGGHYKPTELDTASAKIVVELEGSPGYWADVKEPLPESQSSTSQPSSGIAVVGGDGSTLGTTSSTSSGAVSSLSGNGSSNTSSNLPNNSGTIDGTTRSRLPKVSVVTAGPSVTGPSRPAPRTPRELVPASPIPQTPLEYYGGQIPESRMNRALQRLRAAERGELPIDMVRNAGVPMSPVVTSAPKLPAVAASRGVMANSLDEPSQQTGIQSVSPVPSIEVIMEVSESAENTRHVVSPESTNANIKPEGTAFGRGQALTLQVPGATSTPVQASPIPQTPLEYYGKVAGLRGPPSERNWIGRHPAVPTVTLHPATPLSPNTEASLKAIAEKFNKENPPDKK